MSHRLAQKVAILLKRLVGELEGRSWLRHRLEYKVTIRLRGSSENWMAYLCCFTASILFHRIEHKVAVLFERYVGELEGSRSLSLAPDCLTASSIKSQSFLRDSSAN